MKKLYLFLLFAFPFIFPSTVFSQTGATWAWAVSGDAAGSDYAGLVTDSAGNVYTVGKSLAKHSPAGVLQWSRTLSDTSQYVVSTGLAQDAAGNLYLVGYFAGAVQLDTATLTPIGHTDIFVAKFNSNGQVQWAKSIGGPGPGPGFPPSPGQIWDAAWAVAADSAGNCYITGICENSVQFDTITTDPTKGINFVAKYSTNGHIQWVREIPRGAYDIAAGPQGSYYLTGGEGSMSIPAGTYTTKYNANGSQAWTRQGISSAFNYAKGLATDQYGNCFVTGTTSGPITFDHVTITPTGNGRSMFLLKYDSAGVLLWGRQTTGYNCGGENVVTDGQGNAYVTGGLYGNVNFGGNVQVSGIYNGKPDIYAAKYSAAGNIAWAVQAGSGGSDHGKAIGALPNGDVYVAGNYQSGCSFGAFSLAGRHAYNFFVAKITSGPLGLPKVADAAFQLYPNPAASEVAILVKDFRQGTIGVYNLTGQKIYEAGIKPEMKFNVGSWPAGIYAVKLTSGNKMLTRKLVVTQR